MGADAAQPAGTDAPPQAPLSEAHLRCPHATDAWLRDREPVRWVPERGCYLVTSHELVQQVSMDPGRFSNAFGRVVRGRARLAPEARAVLAEGWPPRDTLFTVDPPVHRGHRSVVNRAFSAHRVAGLEPAIRAVAAELVGALPLGEPVDVVPALAVPLPMTVIGDQLGVPRADLAEVKRWSDAVARELSGLVVDVEEQVELSRMAVAFQRYFHPRIQDRREAPRDDVMSDLVAPAGGRDGRSPRSGAAHERFDDADVLAFLQQLLIAGNETTTSAIAALVHRLAADAELQTAVRADPGAVPALVEEVLRLESPVQAMWRVAVTDVELGGVTIPAGSLVQLRYLAANRDPAHVADPDVCRLDRERPRDHLAFGAGIHFCVGAALARMEIRIAAELLLGRSRWIEPAWDSEPAHAPNLLLHGLDRVVVRLAS